MRAFILAPFAAGLAILAAQASATETVAVQASAADERTPPDRPASTMTSKEIAAFNEGLDSKHPYFIRCRRLEETGSLVRKARVCRTNEQWAQSFAQGNQNARDTVEAMTRAPVNSSN